MTEIPAHLRKQAEEAREKAASGRAAHEASDEVGSAAVGSAEEPFRPSFVGGPQEVVDSTPSQVDVRETLEAALSEAETNEDDRELYERLLANGTTTAGDLVNGIQARLKAEDDGWDHFAPSAPSLFGGQRDGMAGLDAIEGKTVVGEFNPQNLEDIIDGIESGRIDLASKEGLRKVLNYNYVLSGAGFDLDNLPQVMAQAVRKDAETRLYGLSHEFLGKAYRHATSDRDLVKAIGDLDDGTSTYNRRYLAAALGMDVDIARRMDDSKFKREVARGLQRTEWAIRQAVATYEAEQRLAANAVDPIASGGPRNVDPVSIPPMPAPLARPVSVVDLHSDPVVPPIPSGSIVLNPLTKEEADEIAKRVQKRMKRDLGEEKFSRLRKTGTRSLSYLGNLGNRLSHMSPTKMGLSASAGGAAIETLRQKGWPIDPDLGLAAISAAVYFPLGYSAGRIAGLVRGEEPKKRKSFSERAEEIRVKQQQARDVRIQREGDTTSVRTNPASRADIVELPEYDKGNIIGIARSEGVTLSDRRADMVLAIWHATSDEDKRARGASNVVRDILEGMEPEAITPNRLPVLADGMIRSISEIDAEDIEDDERSFRTNYAREALGATKFEELSDSELEWLMESWNWQEWGPPTPEQATALAERFFIEPPESKNELAEDGGNGEDFSLISSSYRPEVSDAIAGAGEGMPQQGDNRDLESVPSAGGGSEVVDSLELERRKEIVRRRTGDVATGDFRREELLSDWDWSKGDPTAYDARNRKLL